jgi:hypothetical protein
MAVRYESERRSLSANLSIDPEMPIVQQAVAQLSPRSGDNPILSGYREEVIHPAPALAVSSLNEVLPQLPADLPPWAVRPGPPPGSSLVTR